LLTFAQIGGDRPGRTELASAALFGRKQVVRTAHRALLLSHALREPRLGVVSVLLGNEVDHVGVRPPETAAMGAMRKPSGGGRSSALATAAPSAHYCF
jgi:hypothetical protein